MQRSDDDAEAKNDSIFNSEFILKFLRALKAQHRLLYVIVFLALLIAIGLFSWSSPLYTATAVIGPPGPSPVDSFMSAKGIGANASVGLARRLLGGGGSATNDPFQEYLQLLKSVRLANILVQKDHFLQLLYAKRWDEKNKKWLPPSKLHLAMDDIKRALNRPIKGDPDVGDVVEFLQKSLVVTMPSNGILDQGGSSYPTVALTYGDPEMAQRILSMILVEADNLIRQDMRRDVSARLVFLRAETQKDMLSDQRDSLISVISGQEQLLMMIEADQRFASTLIDPPYAPSLPVSPKGPSYFVMMALALSVMIWIILVYMTIQFAIMQNIATKIGQLTRPSLLWRKSSHIIADV